MFDQHACSDHSLMQSPAFAAALRLCGQTPVILPGGQMILYRRICGVPVAMLPRATPPANLAAQLRQRGLDRTPLILSPDTPFPAQGIRLCGVRERAVLDLHPDEAVARNSLHQKWRNQLNQAEKHPIKVAVRRFKVRDNMTLLDHAQAQARLRGYAHWPSRLTVAFATCAPEQTHLITATVAHDVVAQMLFLTHGRQATYHIGHTTPRGKRLRAHNLLLWRATRHLAEQGHETIDLGLLDDRTVGLNRFKLRTGARRQRTGGTWLYWRPLARRPPNLSA